MPTADSRCTKPHQRHETNAKEGSCDPQLGGPRPPTQAWPVCRRHARKRKLVIDHEMKEVLERLLKDSQCDYVFTSPHDPTKPLGPWVLEEQISQIRKKIKTHPDAGLHAMRHTFLTEAGEYTDPFTLQYVAGHDNIKTTMRYVHPREAAVHKLFARLADLQRP